jgi:CheY-like chemotaxis protein
MKILIVEDNPLQLDWMNNELERGIAGVVVQQCCTEFEFRSSFEEIAVDPPDIVLMDVMLNWTEPAPDMPHPPAAIAAAGHRRAGLRCQKMLQEDQRTSHVPVILYTALAASSMADDLKDIPVKVKYLPKDSNPALLVKTIQETVKQK